MQLAGIPEDEKHNILDITPTETIKLGFRYATGECSNGSRRLIPSTSAITTDYRSLWDTDTCSIDSAVSLASADEEKWMISQVSKQCNNSLEW